MREAPVSVIDALRTDHDLFRDKLAELEQMIAGEATLVELRPVVAALAQGLDAHGRLEADLLFAAIEGENGQRLHAMHRDHEEIGHVFQSILASQSAAEARGSLTAAIELTRRHLDEEERLVFPAGERVLDADELRELGTHWAALRALVVITD